ncbi:MAG: 50S ribosomal protein L25 [Elusimicrobia bacterium]|nr:50S ribosomal protein L25 [Elusimicrobiota bacterium]
MEEIKLSVEAKEGKGTKKALSALRSSSKIPGVIYGGNKPPINVALSEKDLMAARRKGGVNAILHLQVGGKSETVIVKELQRHPVTDRLVHADFQRISLTQKIEAKVPLHIIGEAPGVKNSGGLLQYELRELRIRALPANIPQSVEVDVSHLELHQHLQVKDLKVPEGVEILDAAEHMVVHVTIVKEEVAEVAPAAAAAEGAEAATAEPEVASTKGKKDEEGKVIPKEAKAAPAAEKGKEPAKKEEKK